MITGNGWEKYCIWEHSETVKTLYAARCRLEAEEMTCAAQAAELLAPLVSPGDELLDAGCGSGYFFHSLKKRNIPVAYTGIDAAPSLIEIGRRLLPAHGLAADQLKVMRIEDMAGRVDHTVCMNVLSNMDNFHRPLERILRCTRKSVILRESCTELAQYTYVKDEYLDPGVDLKVHVNAYGLGEWLAFIRGHGFSVRQVRDERTLDRPEMVIGHPHYWKFFVAERISSSAPQP